MAGLVFSGYSNLSEVPVS